MISLMLCYVSWISLIDLRSTSLQSMNIILMKEPFIHHNEKCTISAKGDCLWRTSVTLHVFSFEIIFRALIQLQSVTLQNGCILGEQFFMLNLSITLLI